MKRAFETIIVLTALLGISFLGWNEASAACTDHNNQPWTPANNATIGGHHCNISTFKVASGTKVNVGTEGLRITATDIEIAGELNADYKGKPGGTGGPGGSVRQDGGKRGSSGTGGSYSHGGNRASSNGGDGSGKGCHLSKPCEVINIDIFGLIPDITFLLREGHQCGGGGAGGGGGGGYGSAGCAGDTGNTAWTDHSISDGHAFPDYINCDGGDGSSGGSGGTASSVDVVDFGAGGGGAGGGGAGGAVGTVGYRGGNGGGKIVLEAKNSFVKRAGALITANGENGGVGGVGGPSVYANDYYCSWKWRVCFIGCITIASHSNWCQTQWYAGADGGASGAGSGGGILINAYSIVIEDQNNIRANGGNGYAGSQSGKGGAGKVIMKYDPVGGCVGCSTATQLQGCNVDPSDPDPPVEDTTHMVTIEAEDMDGNPLTGLYFWIDETYYAAPVSLVEGLTYNIRTVATQIASDGEIYYFQSWSNWGSSDSAYDWTVPVSGADSTITAVFEKNNGVYVWTGASDEKWSNADNWLLVEESSSGIPLQAPTIAAQVFIGTTDPDGDPVLHYPVIDTNDAVCKDLNIAAGSTLYWKDSAPSGLSVRNMAQIEGNLGDPSVAAYAGSTLTIAGDLSVTSTGKINLTNVNTYLGNSGEAVSPGNVFFAGGSEIFRDSSDTTHVLEFTGSNDISLTNNSIVFSVPEIIVDKGGPSAEITLQSNLGPIDGTPSQKTNQYLGELNFKTGKINVNGSKLTVNEQLVMSETAYINLNENGGIQSKLRVMGEDLGLGQSPIVLGLVSTDTPVIYSDAQAEVGIGAYPDDAAPYPSPDNYTAISFTQNALLQMDGGGSLIIDDRSASSGRELIVGGKLILSGTVMEIDSTLQLASPTELDLNSASISIGSGYDSGGSLIYSGSSLNCNIDGYTEIIVRGNIETAGSIAGYGGILKMQAPIGNASGTVFDATLDSNEDFLKLEIDKDVKVTVPKKSYHASFFEGAYVDADASLVINPGATLAFGDGAKLNVYGLLDVRGTALDKAVISHEASTDFYSVNINPGATILAEHAIFEYMDVSGMIVEDGATIGELSGDEYIYDFDYCTFRFSDASTSYAMLTVNNDQELIIDGARFISSSSPIAAETNVVKFQDQGYLLFQDSQCTVSDTGCNELNDLSGEGYDGDLYNRVYWPLSTPELVDAAAVQGPLNSGIGLVHILISAEDNPTTTEYCLWDEDSGLYVDGNYKLVGNSCTWQVYDLWGNIDGFDVVVLNPADTSFNFRIKARNFVNFSSGTIEQNVVNAVSTPAGPLKDRTSPVIPASTVEATLNSVGEKYLKLAWGASSDPDCSGDDCVDYVVLRGRGDARGYYNSATEWEHGNAPLDFKPVKGEWDSFDDGYEHRPSWASTWATSSDPSCSGNTGPWTIQNGVLSGNVFSSSCSSEYGESYVLIMDGTEVDFSEGYVLTADVRKMSGDNGPEISFLYQGSYARWVIGEKDGISDIKYKSKVYYGTGDGSVTDPQSVDITNTMANGKWFLATIYVKDNVARGFLNGTQMWELEFATISGDPVSQGFGVRLMETSAEFDNFMIAPFLTDSGVATTSWNDTVAIDYAAPQTPGYNAPSPDFMPEDISAVGPTQFQINVKVPEAGPTGPNSVTGNDFGTAYFYYVMAVDSAGNVSNHLVNPGFEGYNSTVWQAENSPSMDALDAGSSIEGYYSGSVAYPTLPTANVTDAGKQEVALPVNYEYPTGAIFKFSRYFSVLMGGDLENDCVNISANVTPAMMSFDYVSGTTDTSNTEAATYSYTHTMDGTCTASFGASWRQATTLYQTLVNESVSDLDVSVYAKPEGNDPYSSYVLYLDQNRLDVVTGKVAISQYKDTMIKMREEGSPIFVDLDGETTKDSGYVYENTFNCTCDGSDPSCSNCEDCTCNYDDTCAYDSLPDDCYCSCSDNKYRYFKFRSCDNQVVNNNGATNCGPWRGGIPCNTLTDCPSTYNYCEDFDGQKYCTVTTGEMPGLRIFTKARVPLKPQIYTLDSSDEDFSSALWLKWDRIPSGAGKYPNNRLGTQFLVYAWSATKKGDCEAGNFVADGGTSVPLGYLKPDASPDEDRFTLNYGSIDDSYWSFDRTRLISGLDPKKFYCFRTLARNTDKVATGNEGGYVQWADWDGHWSPVSAELQPPALPEVQENSVFFKYGTGLSADKRAAVVDGSTYQELELIVFDENSLSDYNDVQEVEIHISPHADQTHNYSLGTLRGLLKAVYDEETGLWDFKKEPPLTRGNSKINLLSAKCKAENIGTATKLTFAWTLNDTTESGYASDQDQGVEVYMFDVNRNMGYFRNSGCDQLFHTSYLPYNPVQLVPVNNSWTNSNKAVFSARSYLDKDRLDTQLADLSDLCGSDCAAWGWELDPADYNCQDSEPSNGDSISYRMDLYEYDGSSTDCFTTASPVISKDWQQVAAVNGEFILDWANVNINIDEGRYYWCVSSKDQHDYSTDSDWTDSRTDCSVDGECIDGYVCGSDNTCQPSGVVGPSEPFILGVDKQRPIWPNPTLHGPNGGADCLSPTSTVVYARTAGTGDEVCYDEFQSAGSFTFVWPPAIRNSSSTLADEDTAPIKEYHYILVEEGEDPLEEPYNNVNAQVVAHDDNMSEYTATFDLYQAIWHFGVQAVDMAGNVSDTEWFIIRTAEGKIAAPCIISDTHIDMLQIECNLGSDDNEMAYNPVFEIIDPHRRTKQRRKDIRNNAPAGNFEVDPDYCSDQNLANEEIKYYHFTFTNNLEATLDYAAEDSNLGGRITECSGETDEYCEPICFSDNHCEDSQNQEENGVQQITFRYYDGTPRSQKPNSECIDENTGEIDPDCNPATSTDTSIYHKMEFALVNLQGGTYYMIVKGMTVNNRVTEKAIYRVNICGCTKDPGVPSCKDDTKNKSGLGMNTMALVEGGTFDANSEFGVSLGLDSDTSVEVKSFYMDATEVTNSQYAKCVNEEVCSPLPDDRHGSITRSYYFGNSEFSDYPVVNVSWDMAQTYCQWAGKRLPSELEWRYAAFNTLGKNSNNSISMPNDLYEIGDTVNVEENHGPYTADGIQIVNMFNNVSEWTGNWWLPEEAVDYSKMQEGDTYESCVSLCKKSAMAQKSDRNLTDTFGATAVKRAIQKKRMFGENFTVASSDLYQEENLNALDAAEKEDTSCELTCKQKVVLGSSFDARMINTEDRNSLMPQGSAFDLGFRCAAPEAGEVEESASIYKEENSFKDTATLRP